MNRFSTATIEEEIFPNNDKKDKACLMAHTSKIMEKQQRWANYEFIDCVSYFQCSKCDNWCYKSKCKVACGHWHLLQLTDEHKKAVLKNEKTASVNILDHLLELIPNQVNEKIGLVTYQNGINNNFQDDFDKMGEEIKGHLNPEQLLCIGLYNKSIKLPGDSVRMQCEFLGCRTEVVRSMRKMFSTMVDRLKRNFSHPNWLHIAHSEGGLIARDTLAGLSFETSRYTKNHLIVHTYGSVQPIAKHEAETAVNFYASHDIAYQVYGVNYEKNPNYTIKVVDSKKPPFLPIPGDHGFLGATYPGVLETNMRNLRDEVGFFNAKG